MMRRRRQPDFRRPRWEKDWLNPNMRVLRSWLEEFSGKKVVAELTPEESSKLSMEGLDFNYSWRADPSYHWADQVRRKRREENDET